MKNPNQIDEFSSNFFSNAMAGNQPNQPKEPVQAPMPDGVTFGNEFENQFAQMEIVANQSIPEVPTDNQNRFGLSVLFDVNVSKRNNYNAYGKFGNMVFLPRLALIPFFTQSYPIGAERPGGIIKADDLDSAINSMTGDFDAEAYEAAQGGGGFNVIRRSARQSLELFQQQMNGTGSGEIKPLQDLRYEIANGIYQAVVPYKLFGEIFAESRPRIVLGWECKDVPFVDELKTFLQFESARFTEKSDLDFLQKEKAQEVREILIDYCEEALLFCKVEIERKNAEIENGDARGYDVPNRRTVDAEKPRDLVMMAHARITPRQERQLEAAQHLAESAARNATNNFAQNQNYNNAPAGAPAQLDAATLQQITKNAMQMLRSDKSFRQELKGELLTEIGIDTENQSKGNAK